MTNLIIIGYGYMGHVYEKACAQLIIDRAYETYYKYGLPSFLDKLSLLAVVDPDEEKGKTFQYFPEKSKTGKGGPVFFTSLESALKEADSWGPQERVNAAVIASPISTHFEIARELIHRRTNLLIEKPVCESSPQIEELITLARDMDVRIMPGHVERYNPVVLEAREAEKYGMYGPVKKYQIMRTSKKPERVQESLIIDKLVHDIDLVSYIFGDFRVSHIDLEKKNGEVMECRITTEHEGGLYGEIFSSWLVPEKKRQILIDFEKAVFQGDMIGKTISVNRLTEFPKEIRCYQNNQIKDELCDFIAFMHHPIPTLVKMKDALKSARIIDEIMREVGT